jgi:hypothetical protein
MNRWLSLLTALLVLMLTASRATAHGGRGHCPGGSRFAFGFYTGGPAFYAPPPVYYAPPPPVYVQRYYVAPAYPYYYAPPRAFFGFGF